MVTPKSSDVKANCEASEVYFIRSHLSLATIFFLLLHRLPVLPSQSESNNHTVIGDSRSSTKTHATWVCLKELNQYICCNGLDNRTYLAWVKNLLSWCLLLPKYWRSYGEMGKPNRPQLFFFFLRNLKKHLWYYSIFVNRKKNGLSPVYGARRHGRRWSHKNRHWGIISVVPGNLYLILHLLRSRWKTFNMVMIWLGLLASCS